MRIHDLIGTSLIDDVPIQLSDLLLLKTQCSQFISESNGLPLLKSLPSTDTFRKVKVRFRKKDNVISSVFDAAFKDETKSISKKLVAVNGELSYDSQGLSDHYIFPINNFRFLYNTEVTNSTKNLKGLLEVLDDDVSISKQLLQYTYDSSNLYEGIRSGAEIILFNMSYFYTVNVNRITMPYDDLLNAVAESS